MPFYIFFEKATDIHPPTKDNRPRVFKKVNRENLQRNAFIFFSNAGQQQESVSHVSQVTLFQVESLTSIFLLLKV